MPLLVKYDYQLLLLFQLFSTKIYFSILWIFDIFSLNDLGINEKSGHKSYLVMTQNQKILSLAAREVLTKNN